MINSLPHGYTNISKTGKMREWESGGVQHSIKIFPGAPPGTTGIILECDGRELLFSLSPHGTLNLMEMLIEANLSQFNNICQGYDRDW